MTAGGRFCRAGPSSTKATRVRRRGRDSFLDRLVRRGLPNVVVRELSARPSPPRDPLATITTAGNRRSARMKPPYNVNVLTQAFARRSGGRRPEMEAERPRLIESRDRLYAECRKSALRAHKITPIFPLASARGRFGGSYANPPDRERADRRTGFPSAGLENLLRISWERPNKTNYSFHAKQGLFHESAFIDRDAR